MEEDDDESEDDEEDVGDSGDDCANVGIRDEEAEAEGASATSSPMCSAKCTAKRRNSHVCGECQMMRR